MKFFDQVTIEVKAGDGGDGAVSFRREKYIPAGGPDGGDGGRGGSVYLRVNPGKNTLQDFRYKRKFEATNGASGGKKKQYGKSADDLYIDVPPGTLVYDLDDDQLLADLVENDQIFLVAQGGQGGLGNTHFKNSVRQAPRFARAGGIGERRELKLELKLVADVGLIGLPNVGKSTLLSVVSKARPKIADYPFTTLSPQLGVVTYDDQSLVMADIPGLIEGASQGVGLGHDFLRHIERTRIFLQVVDPTLGDAADGLRQFEQIEFELGAYREDLLARPRFAVINKLDAADSEVVAELRAALEAKEFPVYLISAVTGQGVDELIAAVFRAYLALPVQKPLTPLEEEHQLYRFEPQELFEIKRDNHFYVVTGQWIERVVRSINFDDPESFHYFQRLMKRKGVLTALAERGLKTGDWVRIGTLEFQWFADDEAEFDTDSDWDDEF